MQHVIAIKHSAQVIILFLLNHTVSSPDRLGLLLCWFIVLCLFCSLTLYIPHQACKSRNAH